MKKPQSLDLQSHVGNLRESIRTLADEAQSLRAAPPTRAAVEASLARVMAAAEAEARPLFQSVADELTQGTAGAELWPLRLPVRDHTVDVGPILVALLGAETVAAAIRAKIGTTGDKTPEQIADRLSEITARLAVLERDEERAIRESEAPGKGPAVPRRPDANPAVVLAGDL